MAIIDLDGFETGSVLTPNTGLNSTTVGSAVGRDGIGVSVKDTLASGAGGLMTKTITSGSDTIYFHIARFVYGNSGPEWSNGVGSSFFQVYADGGSVAHLTVNMDNVGHLLLRRGDRTGTVIATSIDQLPASPTTGYWLSIQAKATVHDTTGECIVKINGVEWLNYVGDTRNAGISTRPDLMVFGMNSNPVYTGLDDWLICDTTGSTNNTWPGEISIMGIRPANNGANSGLMGSDGNTINNYQQVDDPNPFNTTDYNGSATPGLLDTYDMTAVGKAGTVLAVQSVPYAVKSDASPRSFKYVMRSGGGTLVKSGDEPLSTTYITYAGPIWTTDGDGTSWTTAKVDAHEFGFEVA